MNPGRLRLIAFGAACAFLVALAFVLTAETLGDVLIFVGGLALFVGLLGLQTRAGILAMRAERGPVVPVSQTTGLIWAGAIPVFFAVLVAGKWLGAFDELNRVGPWDWGPHLAVFLTEGLIVDSAMTGLIVVAVVMVVQRARRRRTGGGTADAVAR